MKPIDRLIVALDVDSEEKALEMAGELKGDVKLFKIGLELFSACGPKIVEKIQNTGCDVFLDLKFHDIPTTVAKAATVVTRLKPFIFNVHASGGYEMMMRTAEAVTAESKRLDITKPKILAVTILTSLDEKGIKEAGFGSSPKETVLKLSRLAKKAGLDGVVASPVETKEIRKEMGEDFIIVTPGVRPGWAAAGDQKRTATPSAAVADGADYIVIGRPITESTNPAETVREILKAMEI
jgi:orotidine-5'-phosphate decarboxylase